MLQRQQIRLYRAPGSLKATCAHFKPAVSRAYLHMFQNVLVGLDFSFKSSSQLIWNQDLAKVIACM